ncbi:MarR family winged helix-turn-helix transcriptional regulator [Pelagibacterium sp.]|uniref:MarR family winged helix-turn-helix transcriptional regulator n=1 Tax=Pelagibacterium sp. TaxID=1967288 RepID=UPI003A94D3A8
MNDDSAPILAPEHQLCFAVYAAGQAFARLYRPLLDPLGLTYPQYLAMLVLWEDRPISVTGIGQRLGLDTGTLTPMLKRLEAAGLVKRTRSATDERRVLVTLTDAGRALKNQARHIPETIACASGRALPDVVRLRDDINALTIALHDAGQ